MRGEAHSDLPLLHTPSFSSLSISSLAMANLSGGNRLALVERRHVWLLPAEAYFAHGPSHGFHVQLHVCMAAGACVAAAAAAASAQALRASGSMADEFGGKNAWFTPGACVGEGDRDRGAPLPCPGTN